MQIVSQHPWMWREPLYIARQTALGEKEQALWIDYGYETESTAGGVIPDDTLSSSPDNSKQASDWRTVSSPLHLPCFGRRQLINTRVIIGIAPLAIFTETLRPLPPVSRAYGANWTGSPNDVKERFVNSFFLAIARMWRRILRLARSESKIASWTCPSTKIFQ